ncbi:type II secretion system F family protein [Dissulfurirhabdus thermomarina]|uniref:Type II secretion system F family protein n=1 Tax=Dissulfurirhabdus thermomarina TaxID=1765737 RepID=A0A6N9TUY1_DISTH|nr:type II secretion system F family protein [Dissulfurirhabdus thermomarina]NDY42316.1 type II secretion system F family protein [Dissulfurirhabdus thermomarina]NMX22423.1 type II secretion system F family protein [Dissulfurirhabdus thermomarina]
MATFSYEALDRDGNRLRESGDFASPAELFVTLRQRGLSLLRYRRRLFPGLSLERGRVRRLVLAEFFRNLALLLRGGVPLMQALEDLEASPGDKALKRILTRVVADVRNGRMFSEALRAHRGIFPRIVLALVAIGEETGSLDRTLDDAGRHIERVHEIITSTKRALMYPTFVVVLMLVAFSVWIFYVLPKMLDLFQGLGLKELPAATVFLIATVDVCQRWWPVVPIFIALFAALRLAARAHPDLKFYWDAAAARTPVFGRIVKASALAFFFEYLSLLASAGIDILKSLDLMEDSVGHEELRRGIRRVREDVMAGFGLTEAFGRVTFFDPFVLRMVGVGEQTGNLPEQFLILARRYMDEVDKLVDTLSRTLEPILIVFAGIIFLLVALGLIGPIYQMVGQIK